jgi:nicotinamide-nucleotide amidase
MDIEILTIGTELLLGFTIDTNGGDIGQALSAIGIRVTRRTSVPDQAGPIEDATREALRRTGAVITTGGLGPTRDDITKKTIAGIYGVPLDFDEALWQALVARWARYGRVPAASNRTQAEVPRGATVLPNRWGSASGLWLESGPGLVIMLPGVPTEMRNLLAHEVVPRLAARSPGSVVRSRTLRATGIPESSLAELLGNIDQEIAPLTLAYLPGVEGVDLRITGWNLLEESASAGLERAVQLIRSRASRFIYGEGDADLAALVLELARARGDTLAVAESCTGGLVGGRITAVPGSSDVFVGGVIAYGNQVKLDELGVDPSDVETHGAVSLPVVESMARGVAARMGSSLAIAITGIAGPGGATEDKPVGTVCYATLAGGNVKSHRYVFMGDRGEIRARSTQAALFQLYRSLV